MSFRNFQVVVVLTAFVLLLMGGAVPLAAQSTGAIHTTDSAGKALSIFNLQADVYLASGDGKPGGRCSKNPLPSGTYSFWVTDPTGSVLLSMTPPDTHEFTVVDGFITTSTHTTAPDPACPGNFVVQLAPFKFTPNARGEYKVWAARTGGDPLTADFKVRESGLPPAANVTIGGFAFYDADTDGSWAGQTAEPGIAGWRVNRMPPTFPEYTYTLSSGEYTFAFFSESTETYTIVETPAPHGYFPYGTWVLTKPISGTVQVTGAGLIFSGPNFGNVCLGGGGGHTLNFWSGRDGQALIGNDDLSALSALNLRDASGAPFDPSSYAAFRTWLMGAKTTNMAYMLSAQLAAMQLNVLNGLVINSNALIYAPGATFKNGAGFATVNAIIAEANAELGLHELVLVGSPYRAYQEALKDALENANNNLTFVQPGLASCPRIPRNY